MKLENRISIFVFLLVASNSIVIQQKGNYTIEIYSIHGQLIKSEKHSNSYSLSVSDLKKGTYLLKLIKENGEVLVSKLVKD